MFSIGLQTVKDKIFWLFIFLLLLVKLIVCNSFPLSFDELHFCLYSDYLSLAYFDHPPLIAYLIKPFLILFGNTDLTPRICSSFVFFITTYIFYCFLKKSTASITISQITILLIYSTPMLNMLEFATDIPFMLFFFLSIYLFYYFTETKNYKYLYLCSITTGLGLLSKYTMFCIYPSIILFLLISKQNRYLFKEKKFYLYFIISFLFFLPVIIWNIQFDIPTVSFYDMDCFHFRLSAGETITNIDLFFQFLGSQLIYYNSILSFIYKKIYLSMIFEYIPLLKVYGIIHLLLIIWIYCHLFYLYCKTKKNIFIFIFSFSIIILSAAMLWSFISFPVEYCAKMSFGLLCFYVAYIFQKKIILKILIVFYCFFGIYLSINNPIYLLYETTDTKARKIERDAFLKSVSLIIEKYQNEIDFVCSNDVQINQFSFFLNNIINKKIKFVCLFKPTFIYSYLNQDLKALNNKNCILFLKNVNLINEIATNKVFDNVEQIADNIYVGKNFNLEKYKELYSDCHIEFDGNIDYKKCIEDYNSSKIEN